MLIRASQLYESSGACKVNQREPLGPEWYLVEGSMNENANSRIFHRVRDLNTCPRVSRMFHFQINKLQRRLAMSSSCSQSYLFSLRVLHVFWVSSKRVYIFENFLLTKLRGEFIFHEEETSKSRSSRQSSRPSAKLLPLPFKYFVDNPDLKSC